MSPLRKTLAVLVVIAVAIPLLAQGRKLKKIERPPEAAAVSPPPDVPLPTSQQCESMIRTVVANYRPDQIEEYLHPDFPNRGQFVDAMRRVELEVTNLELRVESIESTRFTPLQRIEQGGQPALVTDCIADVRTRLMFDDPDTGERTVRDPGRTELRIRFSRRAQ